MQKIAQLDQSSDGEQCYDVYCGAETKPIDSLEELLSQWINPIDSNQEHLICYRIPKIIPRYSSQQSGPLTLVCHDMKGGYLEDRYNNGHINRDAYRFYHWSLVDIFIYFSHHFITIPPVGWTVAAHRNGVRCFGTLIVEHWAEYPENSSLGSKISGHQLMAGLLLNKDRIDQITTALTNLAKHYRFDGWLVNIEAPIPVDKISLMEEFLRLLTVKMKRAFGLKEEDIAVLWYDSVTSDNGQLVWQNELNRKNVRFFKACDGIFLNYCWNVGHLQRSRQLLAEDQLATKQNRIFVGVDVFGRGCMGGGGFRSDIALLEIYKARLSIAIFAPGWTHETLNLAEFESNEHRFWSKLAAYLPERYLQTLPFRTTFCQGFGDRLFKKGQLRSSLPWYNLSHQQLQPSYQRLISDGKFHEHCFVCTEEAYEGGSCLRLLLPVDGPKVKLFRCAIPVLNDHLRLKVTSKKSRPANVMQMITILSFRNIPESLRLIPNDDPKPLNKIPDAYKSVIKSWDHKCTTSANEWQCDEFEIKFNKIDELILTGISVAIQSKKNSLDEHKEPIDYHHYQVLIGELCLE